MTFKAVEDLVGRLPESAYRHRAGEVVFTRAAGGQPRNAARPAAGRPGYVDPQVSASLAVRAEAETR
jgi:hypothetical protein